jgi:hypothetical protein
MTVDDKDKEQCERQAGLQEKLDSTWWFESSGVKGVLNAASVTGRNSELGRLASRRFVAFQMPNGDVLARVPSKSATKTHSQSVTK